MVVCVAVLLVTVLGGVLQYRGINRMGDAVRRQRRGDVERALRNFRSDLRTIFLQPLPYLRSAADESSDPAIEPQLAQGSQRWQRDTDRPGLLASISIGTQSEQGIGFRRLPIGENQFKNSDWPNEYLAYRQALETRVNPPGGALPTLPHGIALVFDKGRPVLVFPFATGAPSAPESQRVRGWCFLEFDGAYLHEHLLPELVARHFAKRDQVAIVARDPSSLIYGSRPALTLESLEPVDAGVVLLDANSLPGTQSGPVVPGGPALGPEPMVFGPPGVPLATIGGNQGGTGGETWLLVVKSQDGSFEELVEYYRQHAIGVNFWMVVLLGGASVMLLLATVRVRSLARQQLEFVAGVSHELRTPLTVIRSTSYNLSRGTITDPGRVRQYGDVIQREARRLIDQIERMLSFAGIQSGRRVYDQQPTDVQGTAERALAEYAAQFAEDGWQIEQHFDDVLPFVVTDGPALESALKNLIENALKYAAEGTWLSITATAVSRTKGEEVQITVADRGPGIAPQDLPHIFEPFYRGHNGDATASGTGLGLCLVDRTLRALGGRVTVRSKVGEGTSFTLHLPVS
jgi:signal transduction histidine kinase